MLHQLIQSIPQILTVAFQALPPMVQSFRPMVQAFLINKIKQENPHKIDALNADFESALDAIAQRDTETLAIIFERYHIPAGGFVEQCAVRMMGFSQREDNEPVQMLGDE